MSPQLKIVLTTIAITIWSYASACAGWERVYESIRSKNKQIETQQVFIQSYVDAVEPILKPLDNFIDAVNDADTIVCNLMCEANVSGGFTIDEAPTVSDLVRYVLTATCYGVIPDKAHRGAALSQLNRIARETNVSSQMQWTRKDTIFFRLELGEILRGYEKKHPSESEFRALFDLWKAAGAQKEFIGDLDGNSHTPRPVSAAMAKAAEQACSAVAQKLRQGIGRVY